MGRIIAIANLAAALADKGKKVLTIDMDPQGNMTSGLGVDKNNLEYSIYNVLIGECNIGQAEILNVFSNLSLVPASMNLAGIEVELMEQEDKQYILKKIIKNIKKKFDFIIIDCPPALGMLTINSMTAADTVIVPIQCEFYALDGLTQLIYTINLIKKSLNKHLDIEGVVFTMYDSRTNLSQEVVQNVRANLDELIYDTVVPRNVRLAEAPSYGLPINIYDRNSAGAKAYSDLADEVIKNKLFQ